MDTVRTEIPVPAVEGVRPSVRRALLRAVNASGLTREQIAAKAGLSRKGLYNLLSADGDPQLSSLEALAHALDLDLLVAPRATAQMQLDKPAVQRRSFHSRVAHFIDLRHIEPQSRE